MTRDAGGFNERFLGEVGKGMDLITENAGNGFVGEENVFVSDGDGAKGSQTLKNEQLRLQSELRECMGEGDAAGVVRIQNLLRELPIRIKTAEVAEIKLKITSGNKRLAEIKEDFAHATSIRNQKHQIYLDKLKIMQDAGTDVPAERRIYILDFAFRAV